MLGGGARRARDRDVDERSRTPPVVMVPSGAGAGARLAPNVEDGANSWLGDGLKVDEKVELPSNEFSSS